MNESISEAMTADHRRCDYLLSLLEKSARQRDWEQVAQETATLREAMELHFRVEEENLFPKLEDAAPGATGPTGVMRMEHQQMRQMLSELTFAANARERNECLGILETLHLVTQQHNAKEEGVLYPLADQAIPGEANAIAARLTTS